MTSGVTPRVRMFAGPNGSGKSTLKGVLKPELIGIYLNPDEIEKKLRETQEFNPQDYGVTAHPSAVIAFFQRSKFLQAQGYASDVARLKSAGDAVSFSGVPTNGYFASVASDFLRHSLLEADQSFTFETVMSSPDKVEFLAKAQKAGFRTYVYFIATSDPLINASRVESRVKRGGHPVPADKIVSRYYRSLQLLPDAIRNSNRAYIFDNSGEPGKHTWIAEVTDGKEMVFRTNEIPAWFRSAVMVPMGIELA